MTSSLDIETAVPPTPLRRAASNRKRTVAASRGLDAALLEAKRLPPPARDGPASAFRLLRRLDEARRLPLVLISAPTGYGKTKLLSDWMDLDERPFAWVTLDEADNDPSLLLLSVAEALDDIEPVAIDVYNALGSAHPRLTTVALPRFARVVRRRQIPFVLALDNAEALSAPESLDVLQTIVERIPPGSQLVLCSRGEPALPVGALRAGRGVVEIRARELAFTRGEVAAHLGEAGIDASDEDVDALAARTEGWPAAVRLAAVALRDRQVAPAAFGGDDAIVAEYIREEFLSDVSPDLLAFLVHTSVLDHLSGPLCDAVLRRRDSVHLLRELVHSNFLLVRLGPGERWYRYHELLRQVLRAELRCTEPELEPELHLRASEWHQDAGDLRRSIEHAVAARDVRRAGDLLWENLQEYIPRGHNDVVQRWLGSFSHDDIAAYPPLALAAAHSCFAAGELDHVQNWTDAAAQAVPGAPPARHEAGIAIMRAATCERGMAQMAEDAARAYELEPQDSPWRAVCCLFLGVSHHLTGDREGGVRRLEEGVRRGAIHAPDIQSLCLAQLALTAIDSGDAEAAAVFATRATAQVERCALVQYPTSALVFAVLADVQAHRGLVEEAKVATDRATVLLADLRDFVPWYQVETRLGLARAAARLGDASRARRLLHDAGAIAARTPDAVALPVWIDDAMARADAVSTSEGTGLAALTTAELRILQFLPTHLSFREIGDRLYVSANTVKTQAHAVYRKLNVGSRSEAVARAFELGMLGAPPA